MQGRDAPKSDDAPPAWTDPAMRAGNIGRGVVYLLVGALALLAAWRSGPAEGAPGALKTLREQPWGGEALFLVTLGMLAYAAWRIIDAVWDLEAQGRGAGGLAVRAGYVLSGLVNLALAAYAGALTLGLAAATGEGGAAGPTSRLMAAPWGRWAVAGIGLAVLIAGLAYMHRGWKRSYRRHIRAAPMARRLDPLLRFGLVARGATLALAGLFFVYAGWSYDASQAGGLAQVFSTLRELAFGRLLLALAGLGMAAFALFCAVEAVYRVIPRAARSATLADEARRKAEQAGRKAERALR